MSSSYLYSCQHDIGDSEIVLLLRNRSWQEKLVRSLPFADYGLNLSAIGGAWANVSFNLQHDQSQR
jgi:hypothetical protein